MAELTPDRSAEYRRQLAELLTEISSPTSPPRGVLGATRFATELICKHVYESTIGPPGKMMLDELATKLHRDNKVPVRVGTAIRTVQAFGNLGAHPQADLATMTVLEAEIIRAAFRIVHDWYQHDILGGAHAIAAPASPQTRGPHPDAATSFAGRERERGELAAALCATPPRVCAIRGMAGIGKSYLVDRVWFEHADSFPGGYVRLLVRSGASAEQLRDDLIDELGIEAGRDRWRALAQRLTATRTLFHVESVDSEDVTPPALAVVARVAGAAVAITGRLATIGSGRRDWCTLSLQPLDNAEAVAVLQQATGAEPQTSWQSILARAEGLPLALHLVAGYLRAGHSPATVLGWMDRQQLSLSPYDPADPLLAIDRERAVLNSTVALSMRTLAETLTRRGENAEAALAGFAELVHFAGDRFGESLGAALSGLELEAFRALMLAAEQLSCVQRVGEDRWRCHPIVRDVIARRSAFDRLDAWVTTRLAPESGGWTELSEEPEALARWIASIPPEQAARACAASEQYALRNGPYLAFAALHGRTPYAPLETRVLLLLRAGATDEAAELLLQSSHGNAFARAELAIARGDLVGARDELAQLAQSAGEPLIAARARARLAELECELGDFRAAEHALELAVGELELTGTHADRAMARLSGLAIYALRGEVSLALARIRDEVVPSLRATGDRATLVEAHLAIAELLRRSGEYRAALEEVTTNAVPLANALGDLRLRQRAAELVVRVHIARGDFAAALGQLFTQVEPMLVGRSSALATAQCRRYRAEIAMGVGNFGQAVATLESEVIPVLMRAGAANALLDAWLLLVEVHVARGHVASGEELATREVAPLAERLDNIGARIGVDLMRSRLLVARGEHAAATRLLEDRVIPACERSGDIDRRAQAAGVLAEIAYAKGDLERALALHRDEELPRYDRLGDRRAYAVTVGQIADILAAQGDSAASRPLRDSELRAYREVGDMRSLALALAKVAGERANAGSPREAISMLETDVLPILERIGDRQSEIVARMTKLFFHLEVQETSQAREIARSIAGELPPTIDPRVAHRIRELAT